MIPKKTTMKSCIGRRATADCDMRNHYGIISAGSEVVITASSSWGMDIATPKCECCGVSLRMSHVDKNSLTLIEEESSQTERK